MIELKSDVRVCTACGNSVTPTGRSSNIVVYTNSGPQSGMKYESRCHSTHCRQGFFYGYSTKGFKILFDDDVLSSRKYLMVTRATFFEVTYLYRSIMEIFFGPMSFHSLAEMYNAVHYSLDNAQQKIERNELHSERMAQAIYTYQLLDFRRRYSLNVEFNANKDDTIATHHADIQTFFESLWSQHKCDEPGCGSVMVIDGGMKITRRVCAARTSGVYNFSHAPGYVLTGCREIPIIGNKFCALHTESNTPSLPSTMLTKDSVEALKATRSHVWKEKINEDVFNIQGLHSTRRNRKKTQFLVS